EKDELKFWLIDVGRLMFEEKAKTRELALDAFESAVVHIRATDYQDHSSWSELREIVSKEYTSLLDIARSEKDPNWHRVWSVLVRIMNRDLCQGSTIINMFLSIVEAGFRSPELSIREQSFDCWRLLVEIFANNKQINIPKRVKLICIPLKSSKSKTETIALKKFDIWWYLICQLRPQLDTMAETIFEPFIYFCFGPSFKTPLCYYFDESYKELGAPGNVSKSRCLQKCTQVLQFFKLIYFRYQSIKQLSGIALIHLLGPATDICKTLLTCPDNSGSTLSFEFPQTEMAISDMLFSTKAKLIIDSCIECTVLLSEMQHLDYRAVNRCVWNNLIRRIQNEKTIPKNDMLQWIKEDMNALLKLVRKSTHPVAVEEITNCLFDLKRYSAQNAYWDMLQKTIQYISHQDKNSTNNSIQFRTIRTRIYILLGNHLADQMSADSEGFLAHQTTVMSFLLYPLEYDQLLLVENVKELWTKLYDEVVKHDSKCCELKNTFCEMIKAMTVAKHGYNLAVLADFFCYIIQSLPAHFEATSPPVKVLELFKDVSRKGLAYKSNLDRVEVMVRCFRELLEKLDARDILILVLPIRNAINEMVSNENGLAMNEVKKTLKVVSNKMLLKEMTTDLISQSNDFVVIEKVWNFQPEMLTEHQREKMMEKRTDIPALYNDMSQSQDSFVIKPWTPSKGVASLKQEQEDKAAEKQQNRRKSILDQLRIDTVEGKNLNVMNLSRTRHSESLETRTTRRKSMSSQKMGNEKKRNNGEIINQDTKSASASKAVKSKGTQQRERRMSRKLLKFDNDEQATNSTPSSSSQHQSKADVSDDVIESSQSDSSETTNRRTSFAKPKAQEPKEKTIAPSAPSTDMKQTEEITLQDETPHLSPIKEMNASDTSTGTKVNDVQNNESDNSQPSITRSPRTSMIGMGGRGAQLINLIRNQQTDQSPKPNTPPQNASTPKGGQSSATANRLMMRKRAIVGSAASSAPVDDSTALETLKEREEMSHNNPSQYLVFSKVLPSPKASPAGSILKRRHNQDESGDDIDSPVNKRKRVSFHDPPVSLTKEYIRQVEECRPASVSRSLQLNSNIMSSADRAKFLMRRKSKSDSISELQNFTNEQTNAAKKTDAAISENAPNDENMEGEEEELTSSPESLDEHEFMMHDDPLKKQQGFSEILEKSNETQSKHIFPSEDAVLEHVMNRYSLDDMFERYIAAGKTLEKTKTIRSLTKELSSKMSDDSKTRDIVLDELSERHSVEFLDHAIQENSNAKVCERLSTLAMMDHVFKQLHTAYNAPSGDKTPAVPQNEKEETIRL
ncbi:AGAP010393-PA, partial [Anopheles gambiae str. PEST]